MMTALFVSGISLFALLIVDICCLPVKTGYYPDASDGNSYANAAPNTYSSHGTPSGQFPPGAVRHSNAPNGIYTPSDPQGRRPAPAVSTTDWAVAPPSFFSGNEGMSAGSGDVVDSQPEDLSPRGPTYQAGGLSHYEKTFEHGNSERETEEQGTQPLPPPFYEEEYAGQGFTSQPQPYFNMGGWGPYPYYDFMFLTGQYPPGTITHTSSSYEQGRDHWEDVHYVRDYAPYDNGPADDWFTGGFEDLDSSEDPMTGSGQGGAQQIQSFTGDFADPESLEDPVAGSGQGDTQAGSGQGDTQAGSGQGDMQAGSGQAGSGESGTQAGSGQAGSGQIGTQAGSGQSGAGQSDTQAGSGQSGAGQSDTQAGSGQGGAGQSGTQDGSGQSGAGQRDTQASSGQSGAGQSGAGSGQGGAGQDSAQAGSGQVGLPIYSHEVFWHPVFRQPGGYHLGKVTY